MTSSSHLHSPITALTVLRKEVWTQLSPRYVEMFAKLWVGFLAVVISFLAQFIIAAIEYGLDRLGCSFPAAILAMLFVFGVLLALDYFWSGLDGFYTSQLRDAVSQPRKLLAFCFSKTSRTRNRGPNLPQADLLNRHMSIGFTIPFVMICRNPLADGPTIGLITACFRELIGAF